MKRFFKKVRLFFERFKADNELTKAILKAEEMYRIYNKRYYVIADTKHELRVLSWNELKQMKKAGMFSSKVKEPDFIRESFYYTPSRFGEFMQPSIKEKKREMWWCYYKAYRL